VDGFVAAVTKSAAIPPGGPGISGSIGTDAVANERDWMKAAVLMATIGIVAATISYAPGPPAYTLTRQSLTIHDRFYPVTLNASNVDVGNVRVIDFNRDADWQPVERTDGIGATHYHSGWFRVSSGKVVRMYRADSTRLVLLPPKGDGTAVLFETSEPEKFLSEVRRTWANGS
jgi:hypothetical protein